MFAAQHARKLHKITRLAAGARADISAVELDVPHLLRLFALARIGMARHGRFKLVEIHDQFVHKFLVLVARDRFIGGFRVVQFHARVHVFLRA